VFTLIIDARGTVASMAGIQNQLPDCTVVACVRRQMAGLVFREAESSSTVVYPVNLEPR
jgi:hypothetical protein